MVDIPASLDAVRARGEAQASWLDGLGRLAASVLDEWELTPDGAPVAGTSALVLPVRDASRAPLMLKLACPDADGHGEIPALKAWRGLGAVRLDRADPARGVLLLERLGPRSLDDVDPLDAAATIGRLYRRLHVPAGPTMPPLAPALTTWLDALEARGRALPAPPRFAAQALAAGRRLAAEGGQRAVLHGDLHAGNVLAGRREPWLVIDPKGFAGDPAYEPAPLLWNHWDAYGHDAGNGIRDRFYAVIDAAELDEIRARDWVVVRALINVLWTVQDAERDRRALDGADKEFVTRNITIAKAMQAVGGGW